MKNGRHDYRHRHRHKRAREGEAQTVQAYGKQSRQSARLIWKWNYLFSMGMGSGLSRYFERQLVHTPLSILANAAAQECGPLALRVQEQVATARRQVDYHLARARAAAAVRATGLRTPVLAPLRALLRTMQRLHVERHLSFELAPQAHDGAFRGEEQDLYELLGNLIDNAGKSARQRVVVDVQCVQGQLRFTIDDDGPGIPKPEREHMFERGVQLDEQRPGSGLGLDIVRALAET